MEKLSGNARCDNSFGLWKSVHKLKIPLYPHTWRNYLNMTSAGGRCHNNARCESMWARMKNERFYMRSRKSEKNAVDELKTLIWRYFMSYWNNRLICTAIGSVPPAVKRLNYYAALSAIAWMFRPCDWIITNIHGEKRSEYWWWSQKIEFFEKLCKVIFTKSFGLFFYEVNNVFCCNVNKINWKLLYIHLRSHLSRQNIKWAERAKLTGIRPSTVCSLCNNNANFIKLDYLNYILKALKCGLN